MPGCLTLLLIQRRKNNLKWSNRYFLCFYTTESSDCFCFVIVVWQNGRRSALPIKVILFVVSLSKPFVSLTFFILITGLCFFHRTSINKCSRKMKNTKLWVREKGSCRRNKRLWGTKRLVNKYLFERFSL